MVAVTTPVELMEPHAVLLLLHEPPPVGSVSVILVAGQTMDVGPDIGAGGAVIDTVALPSILFTQPVILSVPVTV